MAGRRNFHLFGKQHSEKSEAITDFLAFIRSVEMAGRCLWPWHKWMHHIIPEYSRAAEPGSEVVLILCQLKCVLETKKEPESVCKRSESIVHQACVCVQTEDLGANPVLMLSRPIMARWSDLLGPSLRILFNSWTGGSRSLFCVNGCTYVWPSA